MNLPKWGEHSKAVQVMRYNTQRGSSDTTRTITCKTLYKAYGCAWTRKSTSKLKGYSPAKSQWDIVTPFKNIISTPKQGKLPKKVESLWNIMGKIKVDKDETDELLTGKRNILILPPWTTRRWIRWRCLSNHRIFTIAGRKNDPYSRMGSEKMFKGLVVRSDFEDSDKYRTITEYTRYGTKSLKRSVVKNIHWRKWLVTDLLRVFGLKTAKVVMLFITMVSGILTKRTKKD